MIRITAKFKDGDGELFEPYIPNFSGYLKGLEREGDTITFIARGNDPVSTYEEFEQFVMLKDYPIAGHEVEKI